MKKLYVLILALIGAVTFSYGQGEITGKVVDEKGEPLFPASVVIVDDNGNNTTTGAQTDFDGNYSIKPLDAGKYNIKVTSLGYTTFMLTGVRVSANQSVFQDFKLQKADIITKDVVITAKATVKLIDDGQTSDISRKTADDIKSMPTRNLNDIAAKSASAYQADAGGKILIGGARESGTVYYVNGVKVLGNPGVATDDIEEVSVLSGGIPAEFGDATGGIVNIITKRPSSKFSGSASVQTSYGLDPYGYLLANATLRGPIIRAKKSDNPKITDRRTILSFSAAFEYLGRKDASPSAVGAWQVKEDRLNDIKQNPLIKLNDGFVLNSENITFQDMYKSPIKPNNSDQMYKGSLSFDFSPVKGINISFGGSGYYLKKRLWVEDYTLLNSENNPAQKEINYRAFLRFTNVVSDMKKKDDGAAPAKSSRIQNIYYSLQLDFEKFKAITEDQDYGNKLFNYGYIGNFHTLKARSFSLDDTVTVNGITYKGIVQNGWSDTSVMFRPGTANPLGTRFTEQYYQDLGAQQNADGYYEVMGDNKVGFTQSLNQIEGQKGGLTNGKRADIVYDLWYNIGRQYNGYNNDRNDEQYRGRFDFSFDIVQPGAEKNKHAIKFGVEYEQRVQRRFSVNPLYLWDKIRDLTNNHLTAATLDRENPIFYINGVAYDKNAPELANFGTGMNGSAGLNKDTVVFNYRYVDSLQKTFDKNLRAKLGYSNTQWLDVNNLDPNIFDLSMFAPDDLLQQVNGVNMISVRGYDYTGKPLTSNPSLGDYFNAKDANGSFTRLQGAFKPTYAAGYIQDKFFYKKLGLVLGLRVDYYNANQYVLKDPFSLYATKDASQVTTLYDGTPVTHPSNMGAGDIVYLNNKLSQVVGYRNGQQWYNANGEAVASAAELVNVSGNIVPYLANQTDNVQSKSGWDPYNSFEKYKASWIVMPRIQLNFNISDNSQFFAHFDMLSQRPGSNYDGTNGLYNTRNALNLAEYLYWNNYSTKSNPNLRPEKTIDFAFGFKQKLAQFAAVTFKAYYKDFRDMIQLKKYFAAYPLSYNTYANVDFGNTKGVSLKLEFRRYYGFKIDFNYTLQFAEGTGSDDQSQQFLVNANSPNFRTVFPLDYDARHTVNTILDMRFGKSENKNEFIEIKNIKLERALRNFGINFSFIARTGTPYTAQEKVTAEGTISGGGRSAPKGSINGARKALYFRGDLRINKDFEISLNKKKADNGEVVDMTGSIKPSKLYFGVYLLIENLFDTKNQLGVYRFTGSTSDDGYLTDPSTQTAINATNNPNAFRDMYAAKINAPGNYSLPRRIYLGATFSF